MWPSRDDFSSRPAKEIAERRRPARARSLDGAAPGDGHEGGDGGDVGCPRDGADGESDS